MPPTSLSETEEKRTQMDELLPKEKMSSRIPLEMPNLECTEWTYGFQLEALVGPSR